MIGIVGGAGPYAGLDLAQKVFRNTIAVKDQDHLPVVVVSLPAALSDRSQYLTDTGNQGRTNPAEGVIRVLQILEQSGANVCAVACNTMHAPAIWTAIQNKVTSTLPHVSLLSIIDEVDRYLRANPLGLRRVGVLSTLGTAKTGIYTDVIRESGLDVVRLSEKRRRGVHDVAIYDETSGLKVQPSPPSKSAIDAVNNAIDELAANGADAAILACTELPLATTSYSAAIPLLDPTNLLARALIRKYNESKLVEPDRL